MKLTKEREKLFRQTYHRCVSNFSAQLLEYCELVINEVKRHEELDTLTKDDDFKRFAIEAMLYRAVNLSTEYKGEYKALHQAQDILDQTEG